MLVMIGVLWDVLVGRIDEARSGDEGASALEWAIIAAVSVVIATAVGVVIYNVVQHKSGDITKCGTQPVGQSC